MAAMHELAQTGISDLFNRVKLIGAPLKACRFEKLFGNGD